MSRLEVMAAQEGYNIMSWIEKNKDPLNESVVGSFQKLSLGIPAFLFKEEEALGAKDAHLIMHQLACNGILEGLRICGKGFPNRLQYHVLNPNVIPQRFVNKKASELLLGSINLDVNEYKIGHIKVFFQAGILARLEDMRDECPAKLMSTLQRRLCGFLIKPLLNMARQEEEMKVREEGLRSATAKAQELLGKVVELEEKTATLSRENDLTDQLQAAHSDEQIAGAASDVAS
ncbi:unnamed protein product [Rangifer tarandus platyrhynchus]|uniref:Myosin motor domain-containing protein n=2 Tax=Rangifer tarandus platyrhynchus TaxID=3082113 RepID=A0ABN8ZH98_RANTA|nr:unnamed protein product [Rangifer tarandus platyrhynchus]CAI9708794.1 unnamed protein product [Rangifer tarandus platyrhynchus]